MIQFEKIERVIIWRERDPAVSRRTKYSNEFKSEAVKLIRIDGMGVRDVPDIFYY